jgi:hypothetical protein
MIILSLMACNLVIQYSFVKLFYISIGVLLRCETNEPRGETIESRLAQDARLRFVEKERWNGAVLVNSEFQEDGCYRVR